ncbi:hypothetical protein [Streptomyces europaeiscabiei]|uniref:hypothetical protein n=1 Tax=Streptomyces europaeiscabiei TaxID=146819 RepID=UPI002E0D7B20|nr:hypothetical protein OHB30_51475 [Streptomyces europaeiscabiei]
MSLSSLRLTVLVGATIPVPLPADLTQRLRSVRVLESDAQRSAFTLTFDAGRSGLPDLRDTPVLAAGPITPFARVVLVLAVGAVPKVLFDGVITAVELAPGDGPGTASLTVTGEDVSYLLDRVEVDAEYPALDDHQQALAILAPYAADGIIPMAVRPADTEPALPLERVPTQHATDLGHLTELARRHGFVTCVIPGPTPGTSRFYWGPPVRTGAPQRCLSVSLGPDTNVRQIRFRTDALAPVLVDGAVQDPRTGAQVPVAVSGSLLEPLAVVPLWLRHQADVRRRRDVRDSGVDVIGAFSRARARVDRSADAVVAEGEADGERYGDVLRPRALVGVRGAGWSHDGLWYVRSVEHALEPGSYSQRFVLARDGHGSTVPAVLP